ncbi:TetR/AcrR family transcriptional regulator [Cryptosporangium arvum]|uniref:Transcriptional regulator n=1 Tax=Cryptosporangium arvum DSM 44712 TaxID=927661 RepID=A0A010Z5G1_9ACTN|nr:TetR/AcrR family transcriptional regulator [Cryptosporangium arvum]EXG82583.1 transcriptional regulator [Cryptosporangium arvum DSM 44712]
MGKAQSRPGGGRERLITATVGLLSRQGYEATVVKQITTEAAAPMGSFYFHFPGGKEELALAALERGAEGVDTLLAETLARAAAPVDALADCALALADVLARSEWLDGCPVAATALESIGRSPALRAAAAAAFERWVGTLERHLVRAGVAAEPARSLATTTLALLEGAEMLARVRGSAEPLHDAAAALRVLARTALAAGD